MGEMSHEDLRERATALATEARASGLGWGDVEAALRAAADDARRRAAEDRAASRADEHPDGDTPERTTKIGPVTLFTEMGALESAGRHGWRVVGSGTAMHIVVHTGEQWEYRRVFASRATGRALEADGWQRFSTGWFPWGYYQRPTGHAAEDEPVVGGYIIEP